MSVCFSCFGSLLLDHVEQVDDAARADIGAVAAADALVIVDLGHEVLDLDGVRRALTLALHAADAAGGTGLPGLSALVLVLAQHHRLTLVLRDDADDGVGAGLGTGTAAGASFSRIEALIEPHSPNRGGW